MLQRVYGFRKDVNFKHDFETITKVDGITLPPKWSLVQDMPPVYDQGSIGSCTANALSGAIQFIEKAKSVPSRLFLYYNERALQGSTQQDSGSTIGTGITALINWGICNEILWPYETKDLFIKPDAQAYDQSKKDILQSFTQLTNLDTIKESIYK